MKTKLLFTIILIPVSRLFAFPNVGDFSLLEGTAVSSGSTSTGKMTNEVLSYNSSKKQYQVRTRTTVGDKTEEKTEWVSNDSLLSTESAEDILSNCALIGGNPETVSVPVGTFPTCKMRLQAPDTTGFMWMGKVPFGMVKYSATKKENGVPVQFDLVLKEIKG